MTNVIQFPNAPMMEWAEPIREPVTIRVVLPDPQPPLVPLIAQVILGAALGLVVAMVLM